MYPRHWLSCCFFMIRSDEPMSVDSRSEIYDMMSQEEAAKQPNSAQIKIRTRMVLGLGNLAGDQSLASWNTRSTKCIYGSIRYTDTDMQLLYIYVYIAYQFTI